MSEGPLNRAALDLDRNREHYRNGGGSGFTGSPFMQPHRQQPEVTAVVAAVAENLEETVRLAINAYRSQPCIDRVWPTEVYFGRIQRKALLRLPRCVNDGRNGLTFKGLIIHFVDDADYCEVGGRFTA